MQRPYQIVKVNNSTNHLQQPPAKRGQNMYIANYKNFVRLENQKKAEQQEAMKHAHRCRTPDLQLSNISLQLQAAEDKLQRLQQDVDALHKIQQALIKQIDKIMKSNR